MSEATLRNPMLNSLARNAIEGLILEFGVSTGSSATCLAESGRVVYGFDWFRGLPHDWGEVPRGSFAAKPNVPSNVILIEGLFSDTLDDFLAQHTENVGLVHMDCDLYCPTIYVLKALRERFIPGSMVVFDEILDLPEAKLGERPAWDRYLSETKEFWALRGNQHRHGEYWVKL